MRNEPTQAAPPTPATVATVVSCCCVPNWPVPDGCLCMCKQRASAAAAASAARNLAMPTYRTQRAYTVVRCACLQQQRPAIDMASHHEAGCVPGAAAVLHGATLCQARIVSFAAAAQHVAISSSVACTTTCCTPGHVHACG